MPVLKKAVIRRRKSHLKKQRRDTGYSFGKMSTVLFKGKVKRGVLQRFINEPDYVPKDPEIIKALGLIEPTDPYKTLPKSYNRTPEALEFYKLQRDRIKGMSRQTRERLGRRW